MISPRNNRPSGRLDDPEPPGRTQPDDISKQHLKKTDLLSIWLFCLVHDLNHHDECLNLLEIVNACPMQDERNRSLEAELRCMRRALGRKVFTALYHALAISGAIAALLVL